LREMAAAANYQERLEIAKALGTRNSAGQYTETDGSGFTHILNIKIRETKEARSNGNEGAEAEEVFDAPPLMEETDSVLERLEAEVNDGNNWSCRAKASQMAEHCAKTLKKANDMATVAAKHLTAANQIHERANEEETQLQEEFAMEQEHASWNVLEEDEEEEEEDEDDDDFPNGEEGKGAAKEGKHEPFPAGGKAGAGAAVIKTKKPPPTQRQGGKKKGRHQ
jgi:hypothetical protein